MNLIPKFSVKFPENSLQGECGIFAHKLIDFPLVGNTYASKKKAVQNYGILTSNLYDDFRVGDVCITSEGTFLGQGSGHVATVANIVNNQPIAVESNFRKDGRVHYGRVIPKNKIYGVIRGSFKTDLKLPPLVLKITVLMQYEKQWDSSIFKGLTDKFFALTGITLNIYPVYTYQSLKNWWYQVYPFDGNEYSVVAYQYIQDQAIPITYADSQLIIWAINKEQWQGTFITPTGQYQEIGWDYYNTRIATVVCDEGDGSIFYPEKAFIDYIMHEIFHKLYHKGRGDYRDFTHQHYFQDRNMSLCVKDLDLTHLQVNMI